MGGAMIELIYESVIVLLGLVIGFGPLVMIINGG